MQKKKAQRLSSGLGRWKEDFYLCINWIIGLNEELEGNQEFKKMMNDIFIVA